MPVVAGETTGTEWTQIKVLTRPYDVVCIFPGEPVASVQVEIAIPAGKPAGVAYQANLAGSAGYCRVNPTATASWTIYRSTGGGSPGSIGTVSCSTAGVFTFSTSGGAGSFLSVSSGSPDVLIAVFQATADATLSDATFTLALLQ
jgi:hypothetical protein